MDEYSFRRLAPDAVAGRLDPESYTAWREFARGDPERERFIARVAIEEARLGDRPEPVQEARVVDRESRRRRRMFWALAPLFAALGALGGSLGMVSWITTQQAAQAAPTDVPIAALDENPQESPSGEDSLPVPTPVAEERIVDHQPDRADAVSRDEPPAQTDLTEQAEPPGDSTALQLVSFSGEVRVRGRDETGWTVLNPGRALVLGDRVAIMKGAAVFESDSLHLHGRERAEFEITGDGIYFARGRLAVRASRPHAFKTQNAHWHTERGGFVVVPGRFDGELLVAEGAVTLRRHEQELEVAAPGQVRLASRGASRELDAGEIRNLERELLGRHRVLLNWDCDSAETRPGLGDYFTPGAFGEGGAVRRAVGLPAIGAPPGKELFKAVEGARLRMRICSDASRVRIDMRVHLEDGYRAVDAHVEVHKHGEWVVIDVPLSILKAGRLRDEPGWLPGRAYSAFTIAPEVDLEQPLLRRELAVDDVLIYVPGEVNSE